MYIIKYVKSKYYEQLLEGENIKIGTFNYFKKIEDDSLRDENEGAGKLLIHGNNFNTDILNSITSKQLPENTIIKFEVGKGKIIDDIQANCFVYCTSYVENIDEIEEIRKNHFSDKENHIYITNEGHFENRCATDMLKQMKHTHPGESLFIYSFNGKVHYTDLKKETSIEYKELKSSDFKLKINFFSLFEKPKKYQDEKEFRFIWICTNKPLNEDYKFFSINNDFCDVNINPADCISSVASEFIRSEKKIKFADL